MLHQTLGSVQMLKGANASAVNTLCWVAGSQRPGPGHRGLRYSWGFSPYKRRATGLRTGSKPEERCPWLSPPATAWQVTRTCLALSAFGRALCGEVFLICLRCHSPALWGVVAFSWWLGRKPPEPEGVAVLDDKGHHEYKSLRGGFIY